MESKLQKPKRKTLQTIIVSVVIGIVVLWVAGAVATELTDGKSFLNNPVYTPQSGIVQKTGYDLSHPLGFISNMEHGNKKVVVPSTYNEVIDTTAINNATAKGDIPFDQLPSIAEITASSNIFNATINGTIVSDEELSNLLDNAIKPVDVQNQTIDVSLLFPVINPGNQNITVENIASCLKGGDESGEGIFTDWEKSIIIPDKNSEIIVPVDNAEVFRIAPFEENGKSYFNAVVIRFTGPDKSIYELYVEDTNSNGRSLVSPLPYLQNAPEVGKNGAYTPYSANIQGEKLAAGTAIFKTSNSDTNLLFTLYCNNKALDQMTPMKYFSFLSPQQKIVYIP